MKLTTDIYEASRGLFSTAELLACFLSYLKPATIVSSNYAKNCSILKWQVISLLVVGKYFLDKYACKCLLVKFVLVLFLVFFIIYNFTGEQRFALEASR